MNISAMNPLRFLLTGSVDRASGAWTGRAGRLGHDCGCTSGAVAAVASLVGYVGLVAMHNRVAPGAHPSVLTAVVVTLAGAVIGKLAGLLYHAVRRRKGASIDAGSHALKPPVAVS